MINKYWTSFGKFNERGVFYCTFMSNVAYQSNQCFILLPWSSLTTYPQTNTKALKQYTGLSGPSYSLTGTSGTQKYALPSASVLQVCKWLFLYFFPFILSFSLACKPLHWHQRAFWSSKGNWAWLHMLIKLWISLAARKVSKETMALHWWEV